MILAVPAAAERARPLAGRRTLWLAGTYYLVGAVALTMWLWRDPASRIVAGNPYDADQFAWFFRYDATAVAHLRLPALITTAMNAPQGISLMWNTAMPLPGVLLAPLTLLAGPQASLTVLMTLGFAGSAVSMFAAARRWGASTAAAGLAGLVYGFSPALIQSSAGHYDLQFAVLPPLIIDAALRLVTGRCGTGRRAAARCGIRLGLLAAAQLFIAEELLLDAAVAAVILAAVLAVSRPGAVAGRIRDIATGTAVGLAVAAPIAGYPLWVQFLGPLRQHGSPFAADFYKNDLAGFVLPPPSMLAHTADSAAFAARFQGGLPEYLGYLGWPMLAVLAVIATLFWRRLPVRATAVTFAVLSALSLGGTLLADGREHEGIVLPWHWLQALPVAASVIPDRFSIIADGAAAALLAFGLDAARSRWPARGWLIAAAAAIAILPLVPRPLPAADASPVLHAGQARGVRRAAAAATKATCSSCPCSSAHVHRPASLAGRHRRSVGDVRRLLYGADLERPARDRRQRAVFRGPVPEPALGAIIRRQRRGGRHAPGHRNVLQTQRRCAGSWPTGSSARRRRGHPAPVRARPLPDRAARPYSTVTGGGGIGWRLHWPPSSRHPAASMRRITAIRNARFTVVNSMCLPLLQVRITRFSGRKRILLNCARLGNGRRQ